MEQTTIFTDANGEQYTPTADQMRKGRASVRRAVTKVDGRRGSGADSHRRVMEKSAVVTTRQEGEEFFDSLPKHAREGGGIIESVDLGDGSRLIVATWSKVGASYDPLRYKSSPAWDAIDRALYDSGDPDVTRRVDQGPPGSRLRKRLGL